MREHVRNIHFVGVGGVGMSGIAEVLLDLGYRISGSDLGASAALERLRRAGATLHDSHDEKWIEGCDVVVYSTAIPADNPEIRAARAAKIPLVPRAEMLGELMRFRRGIAVAGTHGKTTTTSLVAAILSHAGLDPTVIVGGQVNSLDSNARLGAGEYLVAEADESDASFLHLQPLLAIVTNIDADHLGTYGGQFLRLQQTFLEFLHNLPFYGLAVLCQDDPVIAALASDVRKPVLTYGFSNAADFRIGDVTQRGIKMYFTVNRPGRGELRTSLNMPGRHNVLNATAAIAIADKLQIDDAVINDALGEFTGTGRRFQILGDIEVGPGKALVVDDYAHHPREIAATLEAARGTWPERRIVCVFQPHRYTRTRDLLDDFGLVLGEQSPLLITEVYAAGEPPDSTADGRALCRVIRNRGVVDPIFVEGIEEIPHTLEALLREDDVVLMLGAGNIGQAARDLVRRGLLTGPKQ